VRTGYPRTFPSDEASSWRRIRRYAVPRWMIDRATERRLAGDWRGACTAANVDVDFGLADIARQHGRAIADAVEEDLRELVPDLMRWHLPRFLLGHTAIRPGQLVVLTGYGKRAADGPYLYVSPLEMVDGPQRLTLRFGEIDHGTGPVRSGLVQNWATARHLWDARQAGELRERCGGGERAPFRNADGTPRDVSELPIADPGPGDPAGRAEWATLLHDRGEVERACGVAEISLGDTPQLKYGIPPSLLQTLARYPLALTRLEQEIRQLDAAGFGSRFLIYNSPFAAFAAILCELHPYIGSGKGLFHAGPVRSGLRVRLAGRERPGHERADNASPLPEACWRRLPDLDLLRFGDITPEALHPLVSASLFPGRTVGQPDGPPDPSLPSPVRVRCRGEWHEARSADGHLQVPHSAEEQRRERAMRAFGGPIAGCFAVQQAWTSGTGRLPRALRDQRQELFSRVQHGDTPGVLRLLDAGVDPRVRDSRQRTLLHLLHLLEYEALLPRLLAAGLDIEARDHEERTPLHVAVDAGPVTLVRALLDAGARTDVVDDQNRSLPDLIIQHKRKELRFLKDAVERDHPDLIAKYPTWWELDD
jgi:hypothetical protein